MVTAAWLLGASVWGLCRGAEYSKPLLAGGCVFSCALVLDKLLPLHEPILLGWFVEMAEAFCCWVSWRASLGTTRCGCTRESTELQQQKALQEVRLEAWGRQARLQREYVHRTREQLQ